MRKVDEKLSTFLILLCYFLTEEKVILLQHDVFLILDRIEKYAVAVAECRNTHKAAEKLYISQPSLSRYISRIEQILGMPLFYRRNNGMELTEAGEAYVAYAKEILLLRRNMEREQMHI